MYGPPRPAKLGKPINSPQRALSYFGKFTFLFFSSLQWHATGSPDVKYHSIHNPTNLFFFLQAVQNIIRYVVQANNKHHRTKTTMQETNCQALHKAQHQPLTEIKDRINVMQHHVSQFQTYKSYLLICLQFSLLHNMNQNLQNILNMCSRLLNIYASNYSKCLPICIHVQYSSDLQI